MGADEHLYINRVDIGPNNRYMLFIDKTMTEDEINEIKAELLARLKGAPPCGVLRMDKHEIELIHFDRLGG